MCAYVNYVCNGKNLLLTDCCLRYSAAYGNPYLRTGPAAPLPHYSTFSPPDSSSPVLHAGYRHPISGDLYAAVNKPTSYNNGIGGTTLGGGKAPSNSSSSHANNNHSFSHSFSESPTREPNSEEMAGHQHSAANNSKAAAAANNSNNIAIGQYITSCNGTDRGTNV